MSARSVGGKLIYALLARQHAPTDVAGQQAAAQDMAARGLTPQDIAAALGVCVPAVRALLQSSPEQSAAIVADAWSDRGTP
jgi:DNA-directed RNA polymerase specialized sigma24 family protein